MIKTVKGFFQGAVDKVNEINTRYEKPRIKMTPWVKASLFLLRLYLIFMVLILLYKFAATVGSMN